MAAFYGLRRSGVMGLRWSAIDFEGNTLTVDHTVVQYRSDGKNRMKNKSSCRTMPPVPQYRELLLRMQERKATCKEFCGNCYTESEYIYVNELGIPYKPNFVSDHFKRVLKQHGLRPIRFHDSRYTCASLLLKNGVAVKDIQDWLGHCSYATTANIYAHLDTDSKKQPATKMNQTVSITPGISAAIQAGGENSGREPGFKKKILRFSIHEKPEYFQLVPVVGLEPTRCRHQRILSPSRLPIPSHWPVDTGLLYRRLERNSSPFSHALTPYRSARRTIRRAQRLWVLYSFIRPPSSLAETRLQLPVSQFRIARASA